jgi:Tfp pilus assembly protein PilF
LEKDPNCVTALIGIGSSYDSELNMTNAATFFQKALAIDPASAQAHYGLANAYAHLGDKTKARLHFQQYKKLLPQSQYLKRLEYDIEHATDKTNSSSKLP